MINYSNSTQFTIRVTLKHNLGSFGISFERLGDFVLCARSREDAINFAGPFTKGAMRSIDTTRTVEVVGVVTARREAVDLFAPKPLLSLREVQSEREEMEYV